MTREEAIKQLDTMWKMLTSAYDDIADSHVAAYTMAVDALKAQGTCEDAVSRQTLQKELALYPIDDVTSEDEAGYNRAINDVQKMVLHLPSAQLEKAQLSGENATFDCISRQDAIDHWRLIIDATSTDSRYNMGFVDGLEFCISHLSTMPSAQPEPISKEYAKAVRNWLVNYQVKCAELQGRYTPYEVLGWIVSDWRKENEIW